MITVTGAVPRKGAGIWLCMFAEVPIGSFLSRSSFTFLLKKKQNKPLFEEYSSLIRTKFRNVQISVGVVWRR